MAEQSVSIVGAGYVGMALSLAIASKGFNVFVVDSNKEKIALISNGRSPIKEGDFDELAEKFVGQKLIHPGSDLLAIVQQTNITFVCVGTPSKQGGGVNLNAMQRVIADIGSALKEKSDYHLIVIRSTVPPGTIQTLIELAEKASGKKWGRDFGLVSNPEFLREGSSIEDFFEGKFNIIGAMDEKEGLVLATFYNELGLKNVHILNRESAELFKYLNNWWHALKIGFANEVGRVANHFGVDGKEIMKIFVTDDRLNVSTYYMRPGFAFGGSCLPKDVRAMNNIADKEGIDLPILKGILPSNDIHISSAANIIRSMNVKNIGFAGLVFKEATDDFRESPYLELISEFGKKDVNKFVYDKNLQSKDLIGVNKSFIDGFFAATKPTVCQTLKELIASSDVIVAGTLPKEEFEFVIVEAEAQQKQVLELTGRILVDLKAHIRSYV
ncbi:MAG: nucleotide sugar dehydrogenase [Candidatus Woesearchaeota archaeon]